MKNIIAHVKIYLASSEALDEADIEAVTSFEIGNFKMPLPDIISILCHKFCEENFPKCQFVDFEVISYE